MFDILLYTQLWLTKVGNPIPKSEFFICFASSNQNYWSDNCEEGEGSNNSQADHNSYTFIVQLTAFFNSWQEYKK